MLKYQNINNITGWIVFLIATIVFWITVEPTASYWDCGEFIAVSYKLEVPHPPGAPLFLLIGRLFSLLAGDNVENVAYWINIVSVLSSGFTVLFLFWSLTLFGKKLLGVKTGEETPTQTATLIGGALVGSLAFIFSDSFWFSAVEAEVYAMSSFFTAFVVWAILKWDVIEDDRLANRWLILIAYMMGLSIGVHLLNLVTIPALGLIYYFKKSKNVTRKGIIGTMVISGAIIVLINNIIIPGFPSIAGNMELFFVNGLGLPFGTGIIVFPILLIGALVYGIYYTHVKEKPLFNTALISLAFILIGYSSYTSLVIRSNYNPPIDENNPENIMSFVSYLKREQYGSRPLFYGQYFDAKVTEQKLSSKVWVKGKDKYIISDHKIETVHDKKRSTFLPRAYSSDPRHMRLYRDWMGLDSNEVPNFADNIWYLLRYQIGHMYMRYFMWNFAGRESDIQHAGWLSPLNAFDEVPETIASNKARNNFFMLPLILGIIGMFFQYYRDPKNFAMVALLFFLTGVALVLYLNSPPVEPRERDYIYTGSFYTFSIWIGFGVMGISKFILEKTKKGIAIPIVVTLLSLTAPAIMAKQGWNDHDRSNRYFSVDSAKNFLASCAPNAILFTGGDNDTFPLWYVQEVEGFRTDVRVIVLSYFNTDWYIDQMTRDAYDSKALPFSLDQSHFRQGGLNDYLTYFENPKNKSAINLSQFLRLVREDHKAIQVSTKFGALNSIPSKTLTLNVDSADVMQLGIIPDDLKPYFTSKMIFKLKRDMLEKNALMILDLIDNNKWKRPIYFNSTSMMGIGVDFTRNLVQEGNSYRLLPVLNPNARSLLVNSDKMYENVMTKFGYRGLDDPKVYNSIDHRNFALNMRSTFNGLANTLMNEGKIEKAKSVLNKSLEAIPDKSIPYDATSGQLVGLLLRVGEKDKALELADVMGRRSDEMLTYHTDNKDYLVYDPKKYIDILYELLVTLKREKIDDKAQEMEAMLMKHYEKFNKR